MLLHRFDRLKVSTGSGTGDLEAANNLSDVANAATAFANIKQAATDEATGVVELATDAETVTGTATDKVTTPGNITARLAAPGEIGGTTPAVGNFTAVNTGQGDNELYAMDQDVQTTDSPEFAAVETAQVKAASSAGLLLTDDGDNGIFVADGGNVGIGTTSPGVKLDIRAGDLKIRSNDGTNNTLHNGIIFETDVVGRSAKILTYRGSSSQVAGLRFQTFYGVQKANVLQLSGEGNVCINTTSFGTSAAGSLSLGNATAPTTAIADGVQLWAGDYAAGDSRLYIMGEGSTDTVSIGNNAIMFGDEDSGLYESDDGILRLITEGFDRAIFTSGWSILGAATNGIGIRYVTPTATTPGLAISGDSDTGIGWAAADQLSIIAGGVEGIRVSEDSSTIEVSAKGSVDIPSTDYFYFGDPTTDGSWRTGRSGDDLIHQRRESGSWVTKTTVTA